MSEEIKTRLAEIEERSSAINTELETDGADLDALQEEARNLAEERARLNTQLEELKVEAEKAEEARKAVENGAGITKEENMEEKAMTIEELRSSDAYVEAYANYLKSEILGKPDDTEVRALLTTNATAATGYVPVPTLVDDIVRHAWENENILSRVKKTGFRGNVKVAFELSADGAYIHLEGSSAPTEEALTLGIVELKPANIKKWISVSDEMIETTGEGFLRYVYEELAYQVMKKLSYDVVGDISGATYTTNQATAVGIPKVKKNPGITTIATAAANLSDEATNVVVILNRLTEAAFITAEAAGNFAIDPFAGLPRVYTSALPAYSTASDNAVYAIVGDLSGETVNYPEGDGVVIKWDDLSLAEADMVKIVGRQYAAHAVTGPGKFVNIIKPAAVTT